MLSTAKFDAHSILVKYKNSNKLSDVKFSKKGARVAETPEDKELVKSIMLKYLEQDNVELVQPNYIYELNSWEYVETYPQPSQYNTSLHWYYEAEDLPKAWGKLGCPDTTICGGSKDVIVAVIDSGLAFEDFDDTAGLTEANFKASPIYKNINLYVNEDEEPNNQRDDDCNGVVDDYNGADVYTLVSLDIQNTCDINDKPRITTRSQAKSGHPVDTYGHGTFVTGLIASDILAAGNTTISPAFNISIMPISANKHFEQFFTTQTVVEGINYAVQEGADIISLSLTTSFKDSLLDQAIQNAYDAGVMIIAAAGNTNSTAPAYPAAYDNVFSVGAVNIDGQRSSYSTYGDNVDITAYVGDGSTANQSSVYQQSLTCFGNCDKNTINDGFSNYNFIGTSFAAPQVAALAAMLKSQNLGLTPSEIQKRIQDTATDIGAPGKDSQTGYGVINYANALLDSPVVSVNSEDLKNLYRFYSYTFGTHFYTIDEVERDYLISNSPNVWTYEGPAFSVYKDSSLGKPVYRFWSNEYKTHFYTSDELEKTYIAQNYDKNTWSFEGSAFFIPDEPTASNIPVYRFWSPINKRHFYTVSTDERDTLLNNPNTWTYEGVAFYAFPVNN